LHYITEIYTRQLEQINVETKRSARFFSLGKDGADELWMVLHGYGQLAASFLQNFDGLESENRQIIAPEGLSRFYWNGFSGPVVASWMTREDRDAEIQDQYYFLDKVVRLVNPENKAINLLGFSQGVAAAIRWASRSGRSFNKVVLWAGEPAADVDYSKENHPFRTAKVYFVAGTSDQFIPEELLHKTIDKFQETGIPIELLRFDGKHEMHRATIEKIMNT